MSEEEKKNDVIKKLDFKNYLNAYEFETTLPGNDEVVKFRPITTGQLKKLLVYENENNPMVIERALDELISSSIISDGFNINNLYLQDRFFLLVELRRMSKGSKYQFEYKCPKCTTQSVQSIDLSELPVKKLDKDINNVIKISDNLSVKISHVTRGKQKEAYAQIKDTTLSDTQRITEMALYTHAAAIESIIVPDGEINDASLNDRKYLIENISSESYGEIRKWFDENDFGIEFSYTIRCKGCDKTEKIDIPVENFFF
jgi:hypothetical protein